MKRVKAGRAIFQTLIFSQKDDCGISIEQQLKLNRGEVEKYKISLERSHTRYQITDEKEQADGSILVKVRKQYNVKADVSEYFE